LQEQYGSKTTNKHEMDTDKNCHGEQKEADVQVCVAWN
jgi:hypothetical protein